MKGKLMRSLIIRLACAASIFQVAPAIAQGVLPNTLNELQATGYTLMDDLNTPLLHHVITGENYDLRVLAHGDSSDGVRMYGGLMRAQFDSGNEFERANVQATWNSEIARRIQTLRDHNNFLIPLQADWKQYDFATKRYAIDLYMNRRGAGATYSMHCAGALRRLNKREIGTACLASSELNAHVPFLQSFPIDDLGVARQLKDTPGNYRIFALAEPAGKYQIQHGNTVQYMADSIYVGLGIQPVKITNLILAERPSGVIRAYAKAFQTNITANVPPVGSVSGVAQPGPKWRQISSLNPSIYVDLDSLHRDGDTVVVSQLTDFSIARPEGFQSLVETLSYNCAMRSSQQISLRIFNGGHGGGVMLGSSNELHNPVPIQVGTVGETLLNFVCNALSNS